MPASQASQLLQLTALAFDFRFCFYHSGRLLGRRALAFDFDFDLGAPLNHAGRTQALERG